MVDNSKRIESIDNLLMAVLAGSLVVPSIGEAYGLETRLIWAPVICLCVWGAFTGYIKPKIAYSDSQERSIVERIRGWTYVISLSITLLLNSIIILVSLSPYASYVVFVDIAVVISVGFLLAIMNVGLIKTFFWKELRSMNKAQEHTVFEMVTEAGAASIWASLSILILNFILIPNIPKNLTFLATIIILVGSSLMLANSFRKNRKSSKIAKNLSCSLIDSKWSKKYNATISKRERKDPKRQKSSINTATEDKLGIQK